MSESKEYPIVLRRPLQVLTVVQVEQIDRALASLGPFAEVRLIKNKGKLRFIQKLDSETVEHYERTVGLETSA